MTTITRLLVANRGEIARRVFRTCRDLGIETVAVHSDADARSGFVAEADTAISLPGNTPAETYLRGDLILDAARRAGADAVHPGYGFLSESADFARAVIDAGLVWVGPTPKSMEQMASKVEAKKLMAAAGVPVLPEIAPTDVTETDLPLLVKAASGGGGRGMRVVSTLSEVAAEVEQASAEAWSAFGDATVFCEPFVGGARHVEVQIWGDHHGNNVSVLGARDCSVQRRHQKVMEEAPAPRLPQEISEAMYAAARAAGHAICYVGVGTVEFLYDQEADRFWFLEMNTRLQVEHPVTECVLDCDLVRLQLAAVEEPTQLVVHSSGEIGHAVEVRLYAEDPASGYQPQSGRLTRFQIPDASTSFERPTTYGLRVDAGYAAGDEIGTHYDAMIAKVVSWAPSRREALRRLAAALERAQIHGVRTNRDLLVEVLRHSRIVEEELSTDFLDTHDFAALRATPVDSERVGLSAFAATVALAEQDKSARKEQQRIPVGWRNVTSAAQTTRFGHADAEIAVRWYGGRAGYSSADLDDVVVLTTSPGLVALSARGITRTFEVFVGRDHVDVESTLGHVALRKLPRFVDPAARVGAGSLLAPMPGTVVSLAIGAGGQVTSGQAMLVLEAMKMQHTVTAPYDGVVTGLLVSAGDQVSAGDVLVVVQNGGNPEHDIEPKHP